MSVPHDPQLVLSQLAYEQACAMLDRQQSAVETYASRAIALFAVAIVSTSLFGGWVLSSGRLGFFSWLAVVAFVVVTATSLSAAAPSRSLQVELRADRLLDAAERSPQLLGPGAAHRAMARHLSACWLWNDTFVARIATRLQIAAASEVAAVVCWVADLLART